MPRGLLTSRRPRARRRRGDGLSILHFYFRITLLLALMLMAGFVSGILVERTILDDESVTASEFDDLLSVGDVIEENYYYRPSAGGDVDAFQEQLEQHAIDGMLSSLDDDYTRFLVPEQAQIADEELQGEYGGVGLSLAPGDAGMLVEGVNPESPAARAGLQVGDLITRIDNRPVDPVSPDAPVGDLRGPVGSDVTVTIVRGATAEPLGLTLTREAIIVHPVSYAMIDGTSYAWIHISIFGTRTTAELDAALADVSQRGASGVVLDLRGNGGGWVTSAQETIGRFLSPDNGPALYEDMTPGRGGETSLPILSPDGGPSDLPLVVLVDYRTASAAEIVAGSLRDYNRAIVVGQSTFGKGSVQRIFDFQNGASLRVTVAEWFTPSKGRIQDEGIQPDLVITLGENASSGDPFLAAATTMLDAGQSRPTDLAGIPADEIATPSPQPR